MAVNRTSKAKGKVVDIPANAPTIGAATDGGDGSSASVAFTAPSTTTGGPIFSYTAISNPGSFTGTSTSSPVVVAGLSTGTAYTFTVAGTNPTGNSPYTEASNSVTPAAVARAVFGAKTSASVNVIDYIQIATTGNATDFGDLVVSRNGGMAGAASTTRGIFAGGSTGVVSNAIDYITMATTGNATSFGTLSAATEGIAGCSSSTRACFGGGFTTVNTNAIDYVTIATTGNATKSSG